MSRETDRWLNLNTLIGYTEQRGNAWHYRAELQGDESNHYPGPIPVEDVLRRLFSWEVIEAPVFYLIDGEFVPSQVGRKGMLRNDSHYDLGNFKSGYQGHPYDEWLLENIALILDDELGIGSAGLLRMGGQAWVSIEVPENITTPEGVEFRPNLLAMSSYDGSLSTTYKRVITRVVCDNTSEAALGEEGQQVKIKHTKYSNAKIKDAREALQIVHTMAEDVAKEIAELTATKVSDADWHKLLTKLVPIDDETSKIGITKAENKRAELVNLYNFDQRVAPWKGTAYGVSMAYNTWRQHNAVVRKGVPRGVRNMENLINGKTGTEDRLVLDTLATIQA